jgi:hypothetical protein
VIIMAAAKKVDPILSAPTIGDFKMDALNARMVDLLANQYNFAQMASNSSSS